MVVISTASVFFLSCTGKEEYKRLSADLPENIHEVTQSVNRIVLSQLKTVSLTHRTIIPTLHAVGSISYNPRLIHTISSRFEGRIEKLYVRFNFQPVVKGQPLMDIYSPEILKAQQDLLFLLQESSSDEALIHASKQKLLLLGVTAEQLQQIEVSRQPIHPLPVYSPYTGHIHNIEATIAATVQPMNNSINVSMGAGMNNSASSESEQIQGANLSSSQAASLTLKEGMYVQRGQSMLAVYNTDEVWAILNILPQNAALVKIGDKVIMTTESAPDDTIRASINYLEPFNEQNTALRARVYLRNSENLPIGIFVNATIIPAPLSGTWLPRTAVVTLGQQHIAFIKNGEQFVVRQVKTGISTDSLVQILGGLNDNEQVADNAQFLIDSESFISTTN